MILTDLDRKLLDEFSEEIGRPAGAVAEDLGVSTATVTRAAKKLEEAGLLEDTGYAMKFVKRTGLWQWIDKPKTEGGMVSRPGASTVWRRTVAGDEAIGETAPWREEEDPMLLKSPRRSMNTVLKKSESAGAQYAKEQIDNEEFHNWVGDQVYEASQMDPSEVLPLNTKSDAREVARAMFQQFEWDTKRQLRATDVLEMIGVSRSSVDLNEVYRSFFQGFKRETSKPSNINWLADEILEMSQK